MKPNAILFLLFFAAVTTTFAQKTGLINSGEILKQGAVLHDSSEYKKALQLYDKISRSDTNYVRCLYEKALTSESDSQYVKAINYCREGLALKEQREFEPDLYTIYGCTLSDMKEYDQAIKVFDQAIAKYPHTALLYFNKGIALIGQNRYPDAELMFQKTLIVNPYLYSAHYQLALAAIQQGKLIPAFLGCVGYLLMSPQGRYFSKSINMLTQISKAPMKY
jgi:tetratricopeptide (TPR) repeat protein